MTLRTLSRLGLALALALTSLAHLPALHDALFLHPPRKTNLLYSATLERFVLTEKVSAPPPEAVAVSEDQHAEIIYRDEDGRYLARVEFERLLPFIYYKNMELWGLLPLTIQGRTFDAETIKAGRRVMELTPAHLSRARREPAIFPLLESEPGQARLTFPEDRYRLVPRGLEFLNADTLAVDAALSERFTGALRAAGFVFPARLAAGRHAILKPRDGGHVLVDDTGALYRLRRVRGEPVVDRAPAAPASGVRHVEVMESAARDWLGLVLDQAGGLHLLREADLSLHAVPLSGYDAERMDCKLVMDPLHVTAVWDDGAVMRAVAMDHDLRPLRSHAHVMSRAERTWAHASRDVLFPVRILLPGQEEGGAADGPPRLAAGGWWSLAGMMFSVMTLLGWRRSRGGGSGWAGALLSCLGPCGLAAALLALEEGSPAARSSEAWPRSD